MQKFALEVDSWLPVRRLRRKDIEASKEDDFVAVSHRLCVICRLSYDDGDTQALLPCFHRFHIHCARACLAERNECPVCRTPCVNPGHPYGAPSFHAQRRKYI